MERQYAGEYEERVNPFREFIAGERSLRRRQLSAPDRIMYELGQVVSSSRCARGGCKIYPKRLKTCKPETPDTATLDDMLCPGSLQVALLYIKCGAGLGGLVPFTVEQTNRL